MGDTRGLAQKNQLRVKGLAADEAVAGAHPPMRRPHAPLIPAPPRLEIAWEPEVLGAPHCWGCAPCP